MMIKTFVNAMNEASHSPASSNTAGRGRLARTSVRTAVLVVLSVLAAFSSQAQQDTTTTLKASGTQGDYSLTATVNGTKAGASAGPTGAVKFVDVTDGNTVLATETLGAKAVGSLDWTVSSTLTFSPGTSSAITNMGTISANDFNDDGFTDLVFNGLIFGTNVLDVDLSNGNGTFNGGTLNAQSAATNAMITGPFAGSKGAVGLAAAQGTLVQLFSFDNFGDLAPGATTTLSEAITALALGTGAKFIAATTGTTSGSVVVLTTDGKGNWPVAQTVLIDANPVAMAATSTGLAVAHCNTTAAAGEVTILTGTAPNIQKTATYAAGSCANAIAVGNFGASADDIVVTDYANNQLIVLQKQSGGTYKALTPVNVGHGPNGLVAQDFDGDGNTDVAVTNFTDDNVYILIGNGNGTFKSAVHVQVGNGPREIVGGKFAATPGLAVVNTTDNSISILAAQAIYQSSATATGVSIPGTGTHQIAATYAGDSNYDGSTSASVGLTAGAASGKVTLNPATIAFGSATVGTKSTTPVTLTNGSPAAVSISSIAITPKGTVSYTETNNCPASVAAGASCTIQVTFDPQSAGAKNDFVTVTDSEGTQSVTLTGTGVAAAITLSPATIAFGSATVGVKTTTPVTLKNNSSAAVSITSIAITPKGTVSYTETNNCGASVAAASSCTIQVTFEPQSAGAKNDFVTVTDSAGTQTVTLTGTGVAGAITLNPTSIAFGSAAVGAKTTTPVTLKNTSSAAVSITSIAITPKGTVSYTETNNCGASVAAGASCTIQVTFDPQSAGSKDDFVTVTDGAGTQTVTLTGTGVAATVSAH